MNLPKWVIKVADKDGVREITLTGEAVDSGVMARPTCDSWAMCSYIVGVKKMDTSALEAKGAPARPAAPAAAKP